MIWQNQEQDAAFGTRHFGAVLVIYMRYRLVFENAAPFSRRHFISTRHFAKTGRGIFDEGTRQICRVLFEHKSISHVNDHPEMPRPKCRVLILPITLIHKFTNEKYS